MLASAAYPGPSPTVVGPDDIREAAVLAAQVRATAFPPAQSLDGLCEKFNLNNATSLGSFVDACPLGIASGLKRGIIPGKDDPGSVRLGARRPARRVARSEWPRPTPPVELYPQGIVTAV